MPNWELQRCSVNEQVDGLVQLRFTCLGLIQLGFIEGQLSTSKLWFKGLKSAA
jgi:hypothetical protein